MTESKPTPSRLLKLAARAAPWCLGLTATAWLVFALAWGALHGWIVPRIGEFRPRLEAKVSQALGVPVRIGAISAQSTGLIPSFELRDVSLLDAEGRTALRLPRVLAALSPASLWKRGFEQLIIDQPELDIRRRADGKILIAGLDIARGQPGDTDATSAGADWLFAQTEVVVRNGTLRWTDEQRAAPPLALAGVDLVLRNRGLRHAMRIDATPSAGWGERFTLIGLLRQPLLTTHHGRWQEWRGPAYANFPRVDVSQLRQYLDLGADVAPAAKGVGAMRVWADVGDGQLLAATADVALADVDVTLAPRLQPLALASLQGRVGGRQLANGFEFETVGLAFTTADGLRWPGGNVFLSVLEGEGRVPGQGEFRADRLDLAALAQIGNRLPLAEAAHDALATYAPEGLVERIDASWQGRMEAPSSFKAKGRVSRLEIASGAPAPRASSASAASSRPPRGRPGLRGATVDFDLTQAGGRATLAIDKGSLTFPGIFDEPEVPLDSLSTDVIWQSLGDKLSVKVSGLKFANADAEGVAQATWRTSDPASSSSHSRFPGVLDLSGSLSRGEGNRVHRYLPLELGDDARHYVRDAVVAGRASAKFKVKGDLHDFPFADARLGEFNIAASVQNANYAFIPRSIQPAGELPWPPLTQLDGELVFDRVSMRIKGAAGRLGGVAGMPALPVSRADAEIPDLGHTVVNVSADARGPLADMLAIVRGSPIDALTGQALAQASATGAADLKLRLNLPIASIDKSRVQGSVTLAGNDVQLAPDTPLLGRARGVVGFSETGFSIAGGQARVLGGDLKFDGGAQPPTPSTAPGAEPVLLFRGQGVVTAEGLRQARELQGLARIAENASGSTAYNAVLAFRRGVPELTLTSSLQGLALNLPPPLNKTAETSLPLRIERSLTAASAANPKAPLQDQLALEIGRVVSVAYTRDIGGAAGQTGAGARVLRGTINVGAPPIDPASASAEGVVASVNLDWVNLDAWQSLMGRPTASPVSSLATPATAARPPPAGDSANAANASANAASALQAYMPTRVALRAKEFSTGGRTLHKLVVGATREDQSWKADVDATELNGYVEYHPAAAGAGRVYARLKRLVIAPSATTAVDSLLDAPAESVPALDIVVDDFELKGHNLGRVEMEAVNRGGSLAQRDGAALREWRLNRLSVSNPQASFTASGNWAALNAQAGGPRRTVMNFKLDIVDAGGLLGRFGMLDVFRRGKGRMEGQIAWVGSPLSLDSPTLAGQLNVNIESGQFLKADPGITKLLGVLSLQALPRRLTLDFRDVFSEGFAFDFIRGDVHIEQGIASTNNLQMKGVNAAVLMEGQADIGRETQALKVVVIPEINAGTASLVATVINPAIGVGTFLAQMFLRRPLMEAATQEFHVDGSWADPKITKAPRRSVLLPDEKTEALSPARNGVTR